MSQWKNTDAAGNSVNYAAAQFGKTPNTGNQTALFGNTTVGAFVNGAAVGVFGVDTTEMSVGGGAVIAITITDPGSGYTANGTVTISGGGGADATANAQANSSGRIAAVNITAGGSSYESDPTVTISAPTAQTFNSNTALVQTATFNANTAVDGATEFITVASNPFVNNDVVQYLVAAGNTAVTGLTNATSYYVVSANSTGVKLSTTLGGDAANVAPTAVSETGHTLRRTGFLAVGSNKFTNGDIVQYLVAAGNTALTGLSNASYYYAKTANSTGLYLAATDNGPIIALTPGVTETGHSLTGKTATAAAVISGAKNAGIAHAGWVLRTVGTGGRAGRVTNEVLVAMGSMTADAEDTILPDS
jgi:hypothetical protein